ncbi:hypothetical protein ACET3Z_005245 [Daucus carota]
MIQRVNKVKNATTVNLLNRHTIANTNSRDSPQSDITILVPDLDRIGVRSPGDCYGTSCASMSGTKDSPGKTSNPDTCNMDNGGDDENNTEAEEVEEAGCRQYTAHDENDTKSELPGGEKFNIYIIR